MKYDFIISGFYIVNLNENKVKFVNYKKSLDFVGFPQRWLKKKVLLRSNKFDIKQPALQDVELFWISRKNAWGKHVEMVLLNIKLTS